MSEPLPINPLKREPKFFNRSQRQAMAISAHSERYVCSRGFGKSEGIDARFILRNVWAMPGSIGALISPTYAKAWGNTLPAVCTALARWGYVQDIHYFVGRKAPQAAGFGLPRRPPLREAWGNCLHFWNGTILVVLSFNHGMSANSMSLDWVLGPEAKFLDYEKIKSEVNPANRGNPEFDDCPWHHSTLFTTDMPTSKKGKWILDTREEMIPEHINYIRGVYKLLKDYENTPEQTEYVRRRIRELREDLDIARKYQPVKDTKEIQRGKSREYTVYYAEFDIFDNIEIVGMDFVWQMKRDLPALMFRTSILNERLFKIENGFYSALDENIHFYTPADTPAMARYTGSYNLTGCLRDGDLDMSKPLYVAFDSNAAINSLVIGQVDEEAHLLRVINSMFVKTPNKMPELVQQFCDYYAGKANKEVVVFYDHTFVQTSGKDNDTLIDVIDRKLKANRWNATLTYVGQAPEHKWKHEQIDLTLKGANPYYLFVLFNLMNNEYLKLAMERSGIKVGRNGFEKDKSDEKLPDSPDNPDELKTHITDAFDTLWYGVNFYYSSTSYYGGGVVFLGK